MPIDQNLVRLESLRKEVNEKILHYSQENPIHPDLAIFVKECNRILLSDGAKRIRSIIPVLMSETLSLDRDQCLLTGVIVEMLHFTSLVHDDVIDEENLRRGYPTLNSLFSRNHAVLIGDFIMCEVITHSLNHKYNNETIRLLAESIKKLVTGVVIEQNILPSDPTLEKYLEMVELKTGSLFELSFGLPLIGTRMFTEAVSCGKLFGLLFQIYDDFLDQETDNKYQNIFHFLPEIEIKELWGNTYKQLTESSREIGIAEVMDEIIYYLRAHGYFEGALFF